MSAWFHRLLARIFGWTPKPDATAAIACSHPYWDTCTRRRGPDGVYANWSRCTTCGAWARC